MEFEVLQLYRAIHQQPRSRMNRDIHSRSVGLWPFRVNFWFLHAQVPIEHKAPPTCREREVARVGQHLLKKSWPGMDWHRGPHHLKEATRWSIGGRASKAEDRPGSLVRRLPVDLTWEGTWKISPKRPKEGLQVSFVTTYYWQLYIQNVQALQN